MLIPKTSPLTVGAVLFLALSACSNAVDARPPAITTVLGCIGVGILGLALAALVGGGILWALTSHKNNTLQPGTHPC